VLAELLDLTPERRGYDVILMSDLIFNHSQHLVLLQSSHALLRKEDSSSDSEIYFVFTHHMPKHKDKDLGIFRLAQTPGFDVTTNDDETNDEKSPNLQKPCFHVEYLHTERYPVMFEEDPGDATIRSEIQFYKLTIAANTK
jgi:EEF1A N-terminal glycine/lysine methyltransferase